MNKGFTLIELLAVIVIIGLIALIVIPGVTKTMENSRKKSFITSVDTVLEAAENYINSAETNFTLPINGEGEVINVTTLENGDFVKNISDVKTGAVVVYNDNGNYFIYAFISNGKYELLGYKIDDINQYVTTTNTLTDYAEILSEALSFSIDPVDGQLLYSI